MHLGGLLANFLSRDTTTSEEEAKSGNEMPASKQEKEIEASSSSHHDADEKSMDDISAETQNNDNVVDDDDGKTLTQEEKDDSTEEQEQKQKQNSDSMDVSTEDENNESAKANSKNSSSSPTAADGNQTNHTASPQKNPNSRSTTAGASFQEKMLSMLSAGNDVLSSMPSVSNSSHQPRKVSSIPVYDPELLVENVATDRMRAQLVQCFPERIRNTPAFSGYAQLDESEYLPKVTPIKSRRSKKDDSPSIDEMMDPPVVLPDIPDDVPVSVPARNTRRVTRSVAKNVEDFTMLSYEEPQEEAPPKKQKATKQHSLPEETSGLTDDENFVVGTYAPISQIKKSKKRSKKRKTSSKKRKRSASTGGTKKRKRSKKGKSSGTNADSTPDMNSTADEEERLERYKHTNIEGTLSNYSKTYELTPRMRKQFTIVFQHLADKISSTVDNFPNDNCTVWQDPDCKGWNVYFAPVLPYLIQMYANKQWMQEFSKRLLFHAKWIDGQMSPDNYKAHNARGNVEPFIVCHGDAYCYFLALRLLLRPDTWDGKELLREVLPKQSDGEESSANPTDSAKKNQASQSQEGEPAQQVQPAEAPYNMDYDYYRFKTTYLMDFWTIRYIHRFGCDVYATTPQLKEELERERGEFENQVRLWNEGFYHEPNWRVDQWWLHFFASENVNEMELEEQ